MIIHQLFRVWLYDLKKMVMIDTIDFTNHVVQYIGGGAGDHPASELMEWTLYYDKIGVRIFEGDTVLYRGLIFEVDWSFAGWVFRDMFTNVEIPFSPQLLKNVQVNGNIYQ